MSGARAKRTPKAGASGAEDGVPSPDERGYAVLFPNQYRLITYCIENAQRPAYSQNLDKLQSWLYKNMHPILHIFQKT